MQKSNQSPSKIISDVNHAIKIPAEPLSAFIQRAIAAIEDTKRTGKGIPADLALAKLETKLAAAKLMRPTLRKN